MVRWDDHIMLGQRTFMLERRADLGGREHVFIVYQKIKNVFIPIAQSKKNAQARRLTSWKSPGPKSEVLKYKVEEIMSFRVFKIVMKVSIVTIFISDLCVMYFRMNFFK